MIILHKKHERKNEYKKIEEHDFSEKKISQGSILNISQWREIKELIIKKKIKVGLELSSSECCISDEDDICEISLIQINFEHFKDGRPFSFVKKLRKNYGFNGEIRAKGNILPDQYIFILRCGFNSVEIHEKDKSIWLELLEMDDGVYYQP